MAKIERIEQTCDFDGKTTDLTVSLIFDGIAYDIDVCNTHDKEVRAKIASITDCASAQRPARLAPRMNLHGRPLGPARRSSADRERAKLIRQLAIDAGETVPARGRMPGSLSAKYAPAADAELGRRASRRQ